MAQAILETPIGPLFIAAGARGLRYLGFGAEPPARLAARLRSDAADDRPGGEVVAAACRQLEEYFDGKRRQFDLPLEMEGTPFQRRVWQAIADIPFGETTSYAEIAIAAGAPNAYRAAGSACGLNPIAIVVPCHRVVGSDRGLHGYGGGLDTKVWLLRHEGSLPTPLAAAAEGARRAALPV